MLWIKSLHIVFMVTWYAGLFYLPRLFVYHAVTEDRTGIERFKLMEHRLFFGIMTPGAVLTILFGVWLMYLGGEPLRSAGWLHAKLTLTALLLAYHVYLGKLAANFRHDRNRHGHVFYRWLNELPLVFLVAIVVLAVVKPF